VKSFPLIAVLKLASATLAASSAILTAPIDGTAPRNQPRVGDHSSAVQAGAISSSSAPPSLRLPVDGPQSYRAPHRRQQQRRSISPVSWKQSVVDSCGGQRRLQQEPCPRGVAISSGLYLLIVAGSDRSRGSRRSPTSGSAHATSRVLENPSTSMTGDPSAGPASATHRPVSSPGSSPRAEGVAERT
jgi:hypothetical protein